MDFSELMEAYIDCRKNKRYTREALAFEMDCERNLMELYREITGGNYRIGASVVFVVTKPVKREVFAASFRDRIVQHWLILKLNPLFEKEFIYDSYACRKHKGTLFGVKRVRRFIAGCSEGYTKDCYVLKCDIKGFFMNIDRNLLRNLADRFVENKYHGSDKELIRRLLSMIVMHDPTVNCRVNSVPKLWDGLPPDKSIFTNNGMPMPNGFLPPEFVARNEEPKGIPIGNLTSQIMANLYLNGLDHYIKHHLGEKYYGRYMDDFIVVHKSKEHLRGLMLLLRNYLSDKLKLQLHPYKVSLMHYSKTVNFLGVGIKKAILLTGKRTKAGLYNTLYRYNALANEGEMSYDELESFRQSMNSYLGLAVHYNSYGMRRKVFGKFSPALRRLAYGENNGKVVLKKKKPLPKSRVIMRLISQYDNVVI
jgi:hypothetical protein